MVGVCSLTFDRILVWRIGVELIRSFVFLVIIGAEIIRSFIFLIIVIIITRWVIVRIEVCLTNIEACLTIIKACVISHFVCHSKNSVAWVSVADFIREGLVVAVVFVNIGIFFVNIAAVSDLLLPPLETRAPCPCQS